jgi:PAS domain S-box-containing protein
MESILDNTPASIRVKDRQGKYIFANRRARTLWRNLIGHTAADLVPPETAARWSADDKLVLSDGKPIVREERIESEAGDHVYVMSKFALRDSGGEIYAICVVETDLSELKRAQQDVIDLSARLLSVQDEERRRIARELHDSTSQSLSAVILNLSRIEKSNTHDESARTFTRESMALLNQVHSEIHTASYLLYPPLLDEIGLAPALAGYVEGFSRRSGIDVTLEISPDVGRLERDVEVALFRIVQESLTNVHRHSESQTAEIRLKRAPAEVVLTVSDTGRGMMDERSDDCGDHPRSLGVGIPGMRARLRQLRGTLDIRSDSTGTIVTAVVPLARATDGHISI